MFSLATVLRDGRPMPVLETGGCFFALDEVAPELLQPDPARGLMNLLADWSRSEQRLVRLEPCCL